METLDNKSVRASVAKLFLQLVPFILSMYLLYPNLALALDMDNILLPNGKVPAPRLLSTNSGDYISLSELRRVFLPDFERTNAYELVDQTNRKVVFLPGSIFISSNIGNELFIAQLSKPIFRTTTASGYDELFVPYSDLPQFLATINIYDIIDLGDKLALKNKLLATKPIIPEFNISESVSDSAKDTTNPIAVVSDDATESTESEPTPDEGYKPGTVVANSVFTNNKLNKKNADEAETVDYSILPTAISVINNTRNAFIAMKPKSEKILYLEPNIIQTEEKTKAKETKVDESLPPNVFIVPKGLFRRGIDDNNNN